MLKYFLKLRRRKGFTLTELIIVIAILAVLMAAVAALSEPISKVVTRTSASTDAISANVIMGDYIEARLGFAEKIDVLYAVDSTVTSTDIEECYKHVKGCLNADIADGKMESKAGVLIFRYQENTTEPYKSGYRIYDVNIVGDTSNPATPTYNYLTEAVDGDDLDDENSVFDECMYQYSQNLFIMPTAVTANPVRENVNISVEIIPYAFDPDVSQSISSTTISDYYQYKSTRDGYIALGIDPATVGYGDEDSLTSISMSRTGAKEILNFELRNIEEEYSFAAKNPAGGTGTDIMVFYYIPHY